MVGKEVNSSSAARSKDNQKGKAIRIGYEGRQGWLPRQKDVEQGRHSPQAGGSQGNTGEWHAETSHKERPRPACQLIKAKSGLGR